MNDPTNIAEISQILSEFLAQITGGYTTLDENGTARRLMRVLIVINICWASLNWILSNQAYVAQLFKKVLVVSMVVWLVDNWGTFAILIFSSFSSLGLQIAGGSITEEAIRNPGLIAVQGFETALTYFERIDSLTGAIAFFTNITGILAAGLALIAILVAFGVITLQLFFALVMFYMGSLLAFLTLPFATLEQTKWLSERPIGWVFASALKYASIVVVLSLSAGLLADLKPSDSSEITIVRSLTTTLVACMMLVMSILAPKMAADLLSGAPTLGLSDVAGAAASAGSGVAGGTRVLGGAGGAAATAASIAATGGAGAVATRGLSAASRLAGRPSGGGAAALGAGPSGGARAISFGRGSDGVRQAAAGARQLGGAFTSASSTAGSRGSAPAPSF